VDADERGHQIVHCEDFALSRRVHLQGGAVVANYRLTAEPGYRFIWAAHALLDVSEHARLLAVDGAPTRLFPEAAECLRGPWPDGTRWIEGGWPAPGELRLDTLGPDDGSAVGAVLSPGGRSATITVLDGPDQLRMTLEADEQPVSVALWRNLRGFPPEEPYRSIGVEPMLGRVFDLAEARDGDFALTPADGEVRWRLTITAYRRRAPRVPADGPGERPSRSARTYP
jgi:hypothetical protein